MPTYEYECSRGHHFEAVQRITEPPLTRCRICRSKARRLISATGFILKGGGWYQDGYSSSGNNRREPAAASSGEAATAEKPSTTASNGDGKSASSDNS